MATEDPAAGAEPLKLAVSACFFHADPTRPIFTGKTLQYLEQSVAYWVMSQGDLAVMVPAPGDPQRLQAYATWLDGLVLMGGSDVAPGSYGETPIDPRWPGDRVRDDYEIALARAFIAQGKPVFGICRGLQLLNVALGGTLWQDIATQRPEAREHRNAAMYDQLFHDVVLEPDTVLAKMYAGCPRAVVNSVHHQSIKDLASSLTVEARCPEDQTIEAVRWNGPSFAAAVQWHPEFHMGVQQPGLIDDAPLLRSFRSACQSRRLNPHPPSVNPP